jgi:hypothetical protein
MITVVYRCPRCQSRWVDPREGLGGSETHAPINAPPQTPRLEERLCRPCERDEERSLWQRVPSGVRVLEDSDP